MNFFSEKVQAGVFYTMSSRPEVVQYRKPKIKSRPDDLIPSYSDCCRLVSFPVIGHCNHVTLTRECRITFDQLESGGEVEPCRNQCRRWLARDSTTIRQRQWRCFTSLTCNAIIATCVLSKITSQCGENNNGANIEHEIVRTFAVTNKRWLWTDESSTESESGMKENDNQIETPPGQRSIQWQIETNKRMPG